MRLGVELLVAGGDHHGADGDLFGRRLLVEVDRVGRTGGHARLAVGAHGAVEAAFGLGTGVFFAESEPDLVPGHTPLHAVKRAHEASRLGLERRQLGVRDLDLVGLAVPDVDHLLAAQEVVHRAGGAAAAGDRFDGRPRPHGGRIAAREHAQAAGHHGVGVDDDLTALDGDAVGAGQEVVDHRLADGEDDRVGLDLDELALDRRRADASRARWARPACSAGT